MDEPSIQTAGQRSRPRSNVIGSLTTTDFTPFYDENMPKLIRFLMRLGAPPQEAADAAQDAFTEAFAQWSRIAAPHAWLRTVATRRYLRARYGRELLTDTPPEPQPCGVKLDELLLKEEWQNVYAALGTLPPRQRQVMAWHLDGFGHSEIGTALGMSTEAVRQNYARARSSLKRTLGLNTAGGGDD